ncbi:hypothetical protein EJV46_17080 [Roseococcus sp. SYP-B2431]|uniref:hypothetical protein n=1 Tax=Roseococcus sp. SYP-B2431 TaxID=2496640 RepID=UPI00103E6463|nr:hypothetical protein [Roseococcus sp. SYP-B2431]TCH97035.1 hypothetical protein EJV46_17080 [Roseococcus sp. SYP-B2431]
MSILIPRGLLAATGAVLLLAGCAAQNAADPVARTTIASQRVPGFSCPPAGAVVSYGQVTRTYQGSDPTDPVICVSSDQFGVIHRRMYDFYELGHPSDTIIRSAMQSLYPMAAGRQSEFSVFLTGQSGLSLPFTERYRVEGEEKVVIGNREYDTWIVSHIRNGGGPSNFMGEDIYWIDKINGIQLKRVIRQSLGAVAVRRNFTASSVIMGN